MDPYRIQLIPGELVFAEGDPPTTAYLIESGSVEVSTFQYGARRVLGELGPGSLPGEMAVIDDSPRSATARALTACVLTPIDRQQFAERIAHADPVVRALLLSQLDRYRATLAKLTSASLPATSGIPADTAPALAKIRLESELRTAIERGDLKVHLQPIAEIASGAIAGYEALVRWEHPQLGDIAAADFIGLAEETSLILPIGDYVLDRVCELLVGLRRRGEAPLPFVALNLSARQLADAGLVDRILERLGQRDLPSGSLKLEITESLVMDRAAVGVLIDRCHEAGMDVALDDFGTGYSNLGPLLELHFDQIKLDRRFVQAVEQPRGAALVTAVANLARSLECDLVGEGVEAPTQLECLRRLGCRYAQGWLIGMPLRPTDLIASPG
jgi:EAL domain-containing protein (putative c-di-GMP-specific phosphodiesterase class I)